MKTLKYICSKTAFGIKDHTGYILFGVPFIVGVYMLLTPYVLDVVLTTERIIVEAFLALIVCIAITLIDIFTNRKYLNIPK
jgi:hypothetical protein